MAANSQATCAGVRFKQGLVIGLLLNIGECIYKHTLYLNAVVTPYSFFQGRQVLRVWGRSSEQFANVSDHVFLGLTCARSTPKPLSLNRLA